MFGRNVGKIVLAVAAVAAAVAAAFLLVSHLQSGRNESEAQPVQEAEREEDGEDVREESGGQPEEDGEDVLKESGGQSEEAGEGVLKESGGQPEETGEEAADADASHFFAELAGTFLFSSGAGAWGTELYLHDDGTFEGEYHDSDMGDTGEGYPNGTVYLCHFSGKFSEPVRNDESSYSMKLEYLNVAETPDTEVYEDGQRIIYSGPYGLENTDTFLVYLPGTPVSDLPEEFVSWIYGLWDMETLPDYGIYNVGEQEGFCREG